MLYHLIPLTFVWVLHRSMHCTIFAEYQLQVYALPFPRFSLCFVTSLFNLYWPFTADPYPVTLQVVILPFTTLMVWTLSFHTTHIMRERSSTIFIPATLLWVYTTPHVLLQYRLLHLWHTCHITQSHFCPPAPPLLSAMEKYKKQ